MKESIKNNKIAVTLMELMVAIAIVGFILTAAITYNLIGEKFYHSTSKQVAVLNDAQYLIEQMGRDIKKAATADFAGGVLTVSNEDGNVIYAFNQGSGEIHYTNPGKLIEDELFAKNAVFFNVDTFSNKATVELRLRIGEEEDKSKEESHYVTTFYLRNK